MVQMDIQCARIDSRISIPHLRFAMVASLKPHAPSPVRYVADADRSAEDALQAAGSQGISRVYWLSQRDSRLGWIGEQRRPLFPSLDVARHAWQAARPILLPGLVADAVPAHERDLAQASLLMQAVLDGADCEELLRQEPYARRLARRYELLASTFDEGDPQEIVKLEFDAMRDDEIIAENLWVKLSWLSYAEQDASLRFRFSFGTENYEDVAADPARQAHAAALSEALFPESAVISANSRLHGFLRGLLQADDLAYVERIVYFNAPEGGAQFHHDVEHGHLGVVFAQLSGRTAWLALSTEQLLDAIQDFLTQPDAELSLAKAIKLKKDRAKLIKLAEDRAVLADYLNSRDNDPLEQLVNRAPAFIRHLVDRGHAYILNPGDVILLPQHDAAHCGWHAVYCLDDSPGEALSFAVRHARV
jgi:hypothetical protein